MKQVAPTAHVDTFTRENLPPRSQWPEFLFTLPELDYPPALNCAAELLDRHVEAGQGAMRCIVTDGETWTYSDLLAKSNQVAHALAREMGLVPGNRVLLRGPNNPWLVASWFGVIKAGGVAVTTMPLLRSGELEKMVEIAGATMAICDHRFLEDLEAAAPDGFQILTYGGSDEDDLTEVAAKNRTKFKNVATAADDVCMLAFTSGTTGKPKATMHFHRDVLAIADTFSRHVLQPTPQDLFAASPPLAFTFGLGQSVVFPMRAGAAVYLLEQPTPPRLLEAIERHGITVLATAPTAYRAMIPDLGAARLTSLRACVSAGETLPKATWDAVNDACGVRIIDGIGSTEMLHIFISAAGDEIRPGSTGRAVPGYVAEVQDPDGRPVRDGELGRLAVKGPTGCRYLRGDRQTTYVHDGWNVTGDVYVRDGHGYFHYQARADDMIVSAGYNIAGPEVEEALLRHPAVAEAAVVGAPDEERGMIVKAVVVLQPGADLGAEPAKTLQDFVKSEIAPYKYPRAIEFADALPRTATGKLQRFRLRETT
ncbi:MAG: benzoate-CoA ligase family protein [Chloroflexi bacterium]|nr:MAG: 2-aminobenzoate-CoA ligase [Actinobacteria bacterium 13_2_20CM_2_66_6]TMD35186.1 MAG: benzoate-CoA ligase family protein [Chloroflexota bacterium]TMD72387.1 MAG: benzoate-CoA ligase family protein [Chloroflexota bacterium]